MNLNTSLAGAQGTRSGLRRQRPPRFQSRLTIGALRFISEGSADDRRVMKSVILWGNMLLKGSLKMRLPERKTCGSKPGGYTLWIAKYQAPPPAIPA